MTVSQESVPKVTIGLRIYNEETYLPAVLESLRAQDFRDLEIIISDNASTDGTESICRAAAASDRRIRYIRQRTNIGMHGNLNFLFGECRSPYFVWAGGHDLWHPGFVSNLLDVLESNPSVVCAYPYITCIDGRGDPLPLQEYCRLDTRGLNVLSRTQVVLWGLNGCTPIVGMFRSEALRKTRLFRYVVCTDNLLIFELSLLGSIACVPIPLACRRFFSTKIHYRDLVEGFRKTAYPEGRKYFRLWCANWRLFAGYLLTICLSPHRISKKLVLLAATSFTFLARRGKHMLHDLIELTGMPRP